MQLFKKKAYTLLYEEEIPPFEGPTADAILWDFTYGPTLIGHVLSISAPGNTAVVPSVTSAGVITSWVGTDINISVLSYSGDSSFVYSSISVTRQLRVSPFTVEPVTALTGGECGAINGNISTSVTYDPAYQYTISGIAESCAPAPWDPDTAPRTEALRSSTVSTSSSEACSKDYDTIVYIARQIPYILTIGDVLFEGAIGGTRFNGSLAFSIDPGYWLVAMTDDISVCPGIGANRWALIDQYGVVIAFDCCNPGQ
jgi:hypothetical protein